MLLKIETPSTRGCIEVNPQLIPDLCKGFGRSIKGIKQVLV